MTERLLTAFTEQPGERHDPGVRDLPYEPSSPPMSSATNTVGPGPRHPTS